MAVNVFAIESVKKSLLGGDSISNTLKVARRFLGQVDQCGRMDDRNLSCRDAEEFRAAVIESHTWCDELMIDEPKVLWLSLHGKDPDQTGCLGTSSVSAAYKGDDTPKELIEWFDTLSAYRKKCPENLVVILDSCWGGSPTAAARLTSKSSGNPALLFGPVRRAHRLELDVASGLIFGLLQDGCVPELVESIRVVDFLNEIFGHDPHNGKPFYRVWWWANGVVMRHPDV